MTDTHEQTLPVDAEKSASDSAPTENGSAGRAGATRGAARKGSLTTMLLPELQQMAKGLGITTAKMKKSDLVAAIQQTRAAGSGAGRNGAGAASRAAQSAASAPAESAPEAPAQSGASERGRVEFGGGAPAVESAPNRAADANSTVEFGSDSHGGDTPATERPQRVPRNRNQNANRDQNANRNEDANRNQDLRQQGSERAGAAAGQGPVNGQSAGPGSASNGQGNGSQIAGQGTANANQGNGNGQNGTGQNAGNQANRQASVDDDDFEGGRRRGRRYRDRRGRNRERPVGSEPRPVGGNENEPTVTDDDVLLPVAGVVDCIEDKNAWFVRVEGFFASPDDVYVANSLVRRHGLRRGDAITGVVRQPKDGERREKYNPLVRLDSVNGGGPDSVKNRIEFTKLTPLYPQERLRLETEPHIFTTRVIDLVMPIGKGQRALIASPPKAGKTSVLQAIANAIATNNPEVHLMVVLVDERPEEVTDMQRSVKGEVIASTFDRRPQDHTMVAELSIERAKRLVEMGHDVVVLLDSITRLGRAYNLAAPASGRILSGGVDSTALYPPKRFLGAARNIENGGSLTIIATALVETGSAGDSVIFEEFKGTGNAELKLDRKIADKRIFPAVDVDQSSTRKDELLLSPDELGVTIKLRRVLHSLDPQQAIELLMDRLRKTRTNYEFLMQIAKSTPGQD
ncbi:transcription termination factor Rho [uncultured Jatrophihabitans sp.]|uniref:transcription termination factor Rho n=1 Tax=uncultured Jatrophihabitans sp. TaxID=1610747 RepID=UPI0035CA78D9